MRNLAIFAIFAAMCGAMAAQTRPRARVMRMEATAFVNHTAKPTSSGTVAHEGIVAADPAVLPLGSRIRISGAGDYSGFYTVTDTGSKIVGRRIDIFVSSAAEAKRFGRRKVVVHVLEKGAGKQDARNKDGAADAEAARR